MTAQNVLVIHLGSTNSRSFLFNLAKDEVKLVSSHEILTTDDKDLTAESLKSRHKGEFNDVILIDNEKVEQEAFAAAVRLVSGDCDVLAIDLGSKKTFVGQGSFGRVKFEKIDLGVGEGAVEVLKAGVTEDIASHLTGSWKFTDIENHLGQISMYSGIVPASSDYLELTQAAARQVLRQVQSSNLRPELRSREFKVHPSFAHPSREASGDHPKPLAEGGKAAEGAPRSFGHRRSIALATEREVGQSSKIFLTGAVFGKAPKVGQALLTFLDGVEPEGVFQVFIDQNLFFIVVGALCNQGFEIRPPAGGSNFEFQNLGSVLVFSHQYAEGTVIASLNLDLGLDERLEVEVKAGEILRIPFSEGAFGQVELGLRSGVSIFGSEQNLKIEGGELGFIIDARGRPLPRLPVNEDGRQKLKKWREALEC